MQVVTTSPLIKRYTLEEFWTLPEPADGSKLESIGGVLYKTPMPGFRHNLSQSSLGRFFSCYRAERGDQGILFFPRAALCASSNTHLEPDLFYLSADLVRKSNPEKLESADIAVEVISPETAIYERNTKADTYAALGVRELWLVDPDNETVGIRSLTPGAKRYSAERVFNRGKQIESNVWPDFLLPVSNIFDAVPRKTK